MNFTRDRATWARLKITSKLSSLKAFVWSAGNVKTAISSHTIKLPMRQKMKGVSLFTYSTRCSLISQVSIAQRHKTRWLCGCAKSNNASPLTIACKMAKLCSCFLRGRANTNVEELLDRVGAFLVFLARDLTTHTQFLSNVFKLETYFNRIFHYLSIFLFF